MQKQTFSTPSSVLLVSPPIVRALGFSVRRHRRSAIHILKVLRTDWDHFPRLLLRRRLRPSHLGFGGVNRQCYVRANGGMTHETSPDRPKV